MGSGKSTIGERLAEKLSKSFVDTDHYIEKKHNEKIANIFKTKGEKTFRSYEKEALKEVSSFDIVATGGGIVENKENIKTMKTNGVIVFLNTPFEQITTRLTHDQNRPLWDSNLKEEMNNLYKRRYLLYKEAADIIINTSGKSIEEIVVEIKDIELHV